MDPSQREEEEDRKRKLEAPLPDEPGGDGDPPKFERMAPKQGLYRCRICGVQSADPDFCMTCLAGTMERVG